jgi:hypothetical protein
MWNRQQAALSPNFTAHQANCRSLSSTAEFLVVVQGQLWRPRRMPRRDWTDRSASGAMLTKDIWNPFADTVLLVDRHAWRSWEMATLPEKMDLKAGGSHAEIWRLCMSIKHSTFQPSNNQAISQTLPV